ncbi:hypothetical protein W97_02188 [Coniosporium apollinis CBS 100218]|uniref:Telomeric single stranded DNA binding POT1/Cdc13 domain-containing protein n=1 Tax=Coniosporium apollinis (strain CBS 100218) TaxID=1168221 RepID=R7YM26_CONA1|nr:uncharacterized protein W97_02188 [Coniosporium apollinis CBS 100218]EON62962.1 hypothetical protein W97_02188 [Coniosporium apollinis CBS 100218]
MENVPIAELAPTIPASDAKAVKAIVTLIWPYSSSTRSCAVLLAEHDFRLRQRKGQVRVRFSGRSARAVAESGIGIGDEVTLGLSGAKWLADAGEVKTPGRSVDWELLYGCKLALQVVRDGQQIANLSVDEPEPIPVFENPSQMPASAIPAVDRVNGGGTLSSWASPAFLKRVRLSSGPILDTPYDHYAEPGGDTKGQGRKRRRKSWKDVGIWKYAARTPSPEKTDIDEMSAEEEVEESAQEEETRGSKAAAQLPQIPLLAEQISEDQFEREADITAVTPSDSDGAHQIQLGMEIAGDATELNTESNPLSVEAAAVERHIDVVDSEMPPTVPWSDDIHASAESLTRATPPPMPDAQLDAEDDGGDTEVDSEMYDVQQSEDEDMTGDSGLSGSHEDLGQYYSNMDESESSEDEFGVEEEYDEPEVESERELPALQRQPEVIVLSDTDEDQEKEGVDDNSKAEQEVNVAHEESESDREGITHQDHQPVIAVEGVTAVMKDPVTVMPPPILPLLQTNVASGSSDIQIPSGTLDAPRTPILHPLTSSTLPLPSPFPGESDSSVSSYMNHRAIAFPSVSRDAAEIGLEAIAQPLDSRNVGEIGNDQVQQDDDLHTGDASPQTRFSQAYPFGLDGTTPSREISSMSSQGMLEKVGIVRDEEAASTLGASQRDEPPQTLLEGPIEERFDRERKYLASGETMDVAAGTEVQETPPKLFERASEEQSIGVDLQPVQRGTSAQSMEELSVMPEATVIELSSGEDSDTGPEGEAEEDDFPSGQSELDDPRYVYEVLEDDTEEDSEEEDVEDQVSEEQDSSVSVDEGDTAPQSPTYDSMNMKAEPYWVPPASRIWEPSTLSRVYSPIRNDEESASNASPSQSSESEGETQPPVDDPPSFLGSSPPSPQRQRKTSTQDPPDGQLLASASAQDALQETLPEQATQQTVISRTTEIIDLGSGSEDGEPVDDVDDGAFMETDHPHVTEGDALLRIEHWDVQNDDARKKIKHPVKDIHLEVVYPAAAASEAGTSDFYPLTSSSPLRPNLIPEVLDLSGVEPDYMSFRPTPRSSQIPLSQLAPSFTQSSHLRRVIIRDSEEGSVDSRRSLSTEPERAMGHDISMEDGEFLDESQQTELVYPALPNTIPETIPDITASQIVEPVEDATTGLDGRSDETIRQKQPAETAHEDMSVEQDTPRRALARLVRYTGYEPRGPTPSPITSFVTEKKTASPEHVLSDVILAEPLQTELSQAEESQTQPASYLGHRHENSLYNRSSYLHSNLLTPDPSQQLPEVSPASPQQTLDESTLPATPQLTQKTSALSFSEVTDPFKVATPPDKLKLQEAAVRFSFGGPPTIRPQTNQQPHPSTRGEPPSSPPPTQEEVSSQFAYTSGLHKAPERPTSASYSNEMRQSAPPSTTRPISPPSYIRPRTHGLRTKQSYYTPLASLSSSLNYPPSSQDAGVDVLALVIRDTSAPKRAESGPKDWQTVLSITDPSLFIWKAEEGGSGEVAERQAATASPTRRIQVQIFRPWKSALPQAEKGDVVLLRNFAVRSRKGKVFLMSGEASAWVVWRFGARRPAEAAPPGVASKYAWTRKESAEKRLGTEECKGPPVEVGDEERDEVQRLREWWKRVEAMRVGQAGGADGEESQGV